MIYYRKLFSIGKPFEYFSIDVFENPSYDKQDKLYYKFNENELIDRHSHLLILTGKSLCPILCI